jgi:hypothetical protein
VSNRQPGPWAVAAIDRETGAVQPWSGQAGDLHCYRCRRWVATAGIRERITSPVIVPLSVKVTLAPGYVNQKRHIVIGSTEWSSFRFDPRKVTTPRRSVRLPAMVQCECTALIEIHKRSAIQTYSRATRESHEQLFWDGVPAELRARLETGLASRRPKTG